MVLVLARSVALPQHLPPASERAANSRQFPPPSCLVVFRPVCVSDTMRSFTHARARPRSVKASIPTILVALTSFIQPAIANPFPKDSLHDFLHLGFLKDRSCASYCGVENEHCCAENQVCTTSDNVAGCATPVTLVVRSDGDYTLYTTTWTETETFTSTISSYWAASTATAGGTCTPPSGSGEIACGSICCASWQYCAYEGQCSSNPGATATGTAAGTTSYSTYATTITTSGSTITTQFSAPYRVTGTGSTTTTATGTLESSTATNNVNGTLATTGGSNLSGGAIAGIVIGVIAGVVLLLALCACCIMRGLWHGLLAMLGLGGKKKKSRSRERETIIVEEERYSRHGRAASASQRDRHSGWFAGDRPPRSTAAESRRPSEKKTESKGKRWAEVGGLATMLALLGLRRDKKRRESAATKRTSRARSEVSSSYFSDSYTASSPSEFSSDYTYSSVYTPVQSQHHRGPRTESVVRDSHTVRSASVGAGRYRDEYPPKSNHPPEYADSASDGGRTRDSRRTRRTSTTRVSRAPSRR